MNRIRRRTLASIAGVGLLATAAGVPFLRADASVTDDAPALVAADEWACLVIGDIDLGTCLENPLPDLSPYENVVDFLLSLLTLP